FNYCYPSFWSTFTGTHTNFEGFCSIWLVWENFNPNFTATLHVTSHCNTGSLYLTAFNPRCFCNLYTIFSKFYSCSTSRTAFHTTIVLSAVFNTLRHKNNYSTSSL